MDREPILVEFAGGPRDGLVVGLPEEFVEPEMLINAPTNDPERLKTPRPFIVYRRTDRISPDGAVVFELSG